MLGEGYFIILFEKVNYLRAYTVAATAVTLGVSRKWVDNLLSHHQVPGVLQTKQGVVRRVTPDGLLILEILVALVGTLGLPAARALDLAKRIISANGKEMALPQLSSIRISADLAAISDGLRDRLDQALEITPTPKRGRPRRK